MSGRVGWRGSGHTRDNIHSRDSTARDFNKNLISLPCSPTERCCLVVDDDWLIQVRPDPILTTTELPFRFTQNARTYVNIIIPYFTSKHYVVLCISLERSGIYPRTLKAAQRRGALARIREM